jgi:hypothetical protein
MGQLRFCTKSGVTDTSDMAEKFVETSPFNYKGLSEAVIKLGFVLFLLAKLTYSLS